MKIVVYNMGYGTGLNGSLRHYIFKFWRYLWTPKKVLKEIVHFLKSVDPDVICLIEIDAGSLRNRFRSQVTEIAKGLNLTHAHSMSKYGPHSLWRKLPFFGKQHSAVLSRQKGEIKNHYLSTGMKRLVQEYIVDGISIFVTHLSLRKKSRQKQIKELSGLIQACPRPYLVCGDFNTFKGLEEVDELMRENDLKLIHSQPTFPAFNPVRQLDLILVHKNICLKSSGVSKKVCSDHLPVWVEIEKN